MSASLTVLLLLPLLLALFSACNSSQTFSLPTRTLPENAEQQKFGSFRYKVYDDNTILLTEYRGEEAELVIPDTIEGKKVVALAESMFFQNATLTSIRFGKYLEVVGERCFTQCAKLANVEINQKLWSIGAYAFDGTTWLDSLIEPEQTESTPSDTVGETETAEETAPPKKDPASDFLIVGDGVLLRYLGSDQNVVLPDTVRHISSAFVMSDIISVTLSDSVYTIGEYAFSFCTSLSLVEFSPNLLLIDQGAFYGCTSLTSLVLPQTLKKIGHSAFNECLYLNSVRLSESLESIGEYAFYNCAQLRMIYLPTGIKRIPMGVFEECLALELLLFGGDEAEFKAISIDTTNYRLLDATIVYNAINP